MKNKKLIFGVLSGVAAFSTVLALGNVNQTTGFVSAEECGHTGTVEHYLANATTIEHWACCDCHIAWADEAKTIVVRTVDKDQTRSTTKIQYANYYGEGESYGWEDNSVALYDATYGFAYKHTLTQAANIVYAEFCDTTLDFVTNTSYQLEVTNDTDAFLQANLLNADWGSCGGIHINIEPGAKGVLTIPSTVVGTTAKPFVIKMHNNWGTAYTGTVTVSKPVATKSSADFAAALSALNMPKDFDGNTYFSYYLSTVKPLLEEIQAAFGSEIPAEIAENYNKYNSIFYGDATHGYGSFGYGSHDVSTTTIDGVEFIKLSNFTASGSAELSYQITNVSYSSNKYFMFRVYNPFDTEIRMVAHDNWSKWYPASNKDQTFYLSPNSWATILLDKTGYGEEGDTIIGVMMFNALGASETSNKELLLSPIVDYIYDYSELNNSVYGQANHETLKGVDGGDGLVISKKRSPEYGTVQVINDINEIMYPRVYLNGKNNNNTESYTSVKFYVKNETNTTLWLSSDTFNWDIAEYRSQVQLGGVAAGEWAEFTMDASHFYYGTDTYINLGPADGATLITGNVLVSAFVGVK